MLVFKTSHFNQVSNMRDLIKWLINVICRSSVENFSQIMNVPWPNFLY